MQISHICFADDFFIFAGADMGSIRVIKDALTDFSATSGLFPNSQKSSVLYSDVVEETKDEINVALNMEVKELPVKYLVLNSSLLLGGCN